MTNQPSEPKVSVIVPTYNRKESVAICVESILRSAHNNFEVIVVNTVQEGDIELNLHCTVINTKLRGSHVAKNIGVSHSHGEVLVFVDDDVLVDETWLSNLIQTYDRGNSIAGVGGRVIKGNKTTLAHNNIHSVVGKVTEKGLVVSNFDSDGEIKEVDTFQGCNMSFKKEQFLEIGGFSTKYIGNAYFEETDLCMRFRKRGYKLIFNPEAVVWHMPAPSGGNRVDKKKWSYCFGHNHLLFYETNFRPTFAGWIKILSYNIQSGITSQTLIQRLKGMWKFLKNRQSYMDNPNQNSGIL